MNNLNGALDASMVQRKDDVAADDVDEINVQDIFVESNVNKGGD